MSPRRGVAVGLGGLIRGMSNSAYPNEIGVSRNAPTGLRPPAQRCRFGYVGEGKENNPQPQRGCVISAEKAQAVETALRLKDTIAPCSPGYPLSGNAGLQVSAPLGQKRSIMKTRIIRIGNSQGIRIPKSLLQRSKFTEEVEIEAFDSYLVIRPVAKRPRAGWESAFRAAAETEKEKSLHK